MRVYTHRASDAVREYQVTVLASEAACETVVRLCEKLSDTMAAVCVVSRQPLKLAGQGVSNLVAEPGERLWELVPPSSLVICTDSEQEAELTANTGFPVCRLQELQDVDQAEREVLDALKGVDTGRNAFRGPMLSVCMIAKDEEENIGRALRSVCGVAGEIILVDTGSTDNTVPIARSYGAKVYQIPWGADFSAARNESLAHATGDWILVLDADEAVSQEFRRNILKRLRAVHGVDALSQPLINIVNGQEQDRVSVLRLFRNRAAYRFEGRVHEQVHPSILRAGGKIGKEPTAILHYGYSSAESLRKGRRRRNRELLEAGYRENPERVDYWYHLGHEALIAKDFAAAEFWLRKVMVEAPSSAFVPLSALLLAQGLMELGRYGEAWSAVNIGLTSPRSRGKALTVLGDLALKEGDFASADWAARQLRRMAPSAEGYVHADRLAAQLRTRSLLEQGKRDEALRASERLFSQNSEDMSLAFWYVDIVEAAAGLRTATVEAIRRYGTTAVKAAAIGPLVRSGEWDLAASLAVSTKDLMKSKYHVAALLHAGADEAAADIAAEMGEEGSRLLLLWSVERGDLSAWSENLSGDLPESHRVLARHLREESAVPPSDMWIPLFWLRLAAELHADRAFIRLMHLLPGSDAAQAGKAARVLYETRRKQEALNLALQAPSDPDGLLVLGQVAYENHDWDAAATFLTARAGFGDAPVRAYWWGAMALRQLGRVKESQQLLEEGRKARPLSLLMVRREVTS